MLRRERAGGYESGRGTVGKGKGECFQRTSICIWNHSNPEKTCRQEEVLEMDVLQTCFARLSKT